MSNTMKITKPKTTLDNFEFSEPNEAGTVAFFDPTMKDTRGGIAVVRERDAELIQASEDLLELAIRYHDLITAIDGLEIIKRRLSDEVVELFDSEQKRIKTALQKAGCEIKQS